MSIPRQSIREYVQACQVLLRADDLSDKEQQAVEDILDRLKEKLRAAGEELT